MPQSPLDMFEAEFAVLENAFIRFKLDEGPIRFFRLARVFFLQLADLETRLGEFPVGWLRTKKFFDRALTAFVPTPLRPTLN